MNKKRQREISYIKLVQKETGYSIGAEPLHAESLAKHFLNKSVPFVKQGKGGGTEDLLKFSGEEDGAHLENILRDWKERFVSGGKQFM